MGAKCKLDTEDNLEADMGHHTYWLGMNKYGDLVKEIIFL